MRSGGEKGKELINMSIMEGGEERLLYYIPSIFSGIDGKLDCIRSTLWLASHNFSLFNFCSRSFLGSLLSSLH